MRQFIIYLLCFIGLRGFSQFAPAAGQPGSTAIAWDSTIIVGWASASVTEPGLMDVSQPALGMVSTGDSLSACGPAGMNGVFSLGDGGRLTLLMEHPVFNGPGADFAIFENSFMDTFLEFGFVEVSSDGERFIRFPSACLTDSSLQLDAFGLSDPTKVHNLAGKYRAMYGTPFDLQDITDSAGIDLMNISHVRVTDVIGCISQPAWTSRDAMGRKINDPWPTPFPSSGIDIDALGIIHWNNPAGISHHAEMNEPGIYPNPLKTGQTFRINKNLDFNNVYIYTINGWMLEEQNQEGGFTAPDKPGIYLLKSKTKCLRLVVTE